MTIVITSNEPGTIKRLFQDKVELPMGYDFRIYTEIGVVGLERKTPGDLLASIEDGRLSNEILAMRAECDYQVILIHGQFRYNKDGNVIFDRRKSRWTRKAIRNFMRTLEWVEGCYIEHAENDHDLVDVIQDLQIYLDKPRHSSIHSRPSIKSDWVKPTHKEKFVYWMQGLPKIGPVRAKILAEVFPTPMSLFEASASDISKVKGFSAISGQEIVDFLRTGK